MNGLAVDPKIIADDTVLDVIFAADFGDEIGMICESAAKAVCRALVLAADHAGIPADILFNTALDLKMRFKMPAADDLEDFLEEEE